MKDFMIFPFLIMPILGQAQVDKTLQEYIKRPEFLQHHREANEVHRELISGNIGPTLKLYLTDSLASDTVNLRHIEKALANEQFRQHSTRIDTQTSTGAFPVKFETNIAFRDIRYVGNDMFRQYRLNVCIQWNEKFQIVRRKVTFSDGPNIKSREHWIRGAWFDVKAYYEKYKDK